MTCRTLTAVAAFLLSVLHIHALRISAENDDGVFMEVEAEKDSWFTPGAKSRHGEDLIPCMTSEERTKLYEYLDKATNYQEFGSGGSTAVASRKMNIKRMHTVESDGAWVAKLKERNDVQQAIKDGRLNYVHADIGPVGAWGYPAKNDMVSKWPDYSGSYARVGDEQTHFDLVLVDGRFRPACLLKALKNVPADAVDSTYFLFHDYERTPYHVVEEFAAKVERVGRLQVFRKRPEVNQTNLDKAIKKLEVIPF